MAQWVMAAKKADFERIAGKFQIDKVTARILRNRDLISDEEIEKFLYGDLKGMYSPHLLKDMDEAADRIFFHISEHKKIRIMGDYDVDGICSCYILKEGIKLLGGRVDFKVPDRIRDGYGINESMIDEAKRDEVSLIVTCDNGIAAKEAIAYANTLGLAVIVTDHHEVPFSMNKEGEKNYHLPPAFKVVNPKQPGCSYPFPEICGALVSYKVIQVLFEKCEKPVPEEFLEAAAFATVCDVMELKDENRIVVKYGLKSMQNTKNVGLKALLQVCEIPTDKLSTHHLGFVLGPCFNATGRLDIADRAVELLCEKDFEKAVLTARELKNLNEQRKTMTLSGIMEAEEYISKNHIEEQDIFVIYLPLCHESLAGIIAGRIREKYYKPVLVLTGKNDKVKGSGRSIPAYDMYEGLSAFQEYFTKFGGHKMAAGLSMKEEFIKPLNEGLNRLSRLTPSDFEEKLRIDVPMPISYVTENLVEQFLLLAPFGTGNEKPMFAQKGIRVLGENRVGREKNVGKYRITDGIREMEMVYFGDLDAFSSFYQKHESIAIAYYPEVNEFHHRKTIQIVLKAYKEV